MDGVNIVIVAVKKVDRRYAKTVRKRNLIEMQIGGMIMMLDNGTIEEGGRDGKEKGAG